MIKTGKDQIPVMTFIAILSVCFIINLPGIAIAPIEGKMKEILHTSELEIQLLTTLPNFIIIPFVLISGKLSAYRHKLLLTYISLVVFIGSGVAYMLTNSMSGLIIISCVIGAANGILIPFAMGFVVNTFSGKYLTRTLGFKSATSNFGTVIANFIVGILIQGGDWHLPFSVYLIAIVPLILAYWLKFIPGFGEKPVTPEKYQIVVSSLDNNKGKPEIDAKKIRGLILNNVWLAFMAFTIVIYLPQLLQGYNWNPKISADLTASFFIFVLLAGFFLEKFIKTFRSYSFPLIGLLLTVGIVLFIFIKSEWAMYVGSVLAGIGFGICQPLIYDKTSYAIINPKKNIWGLSLVLTALYIAIALQPFVITAIVKIFHIPDENHFAFILSIFIGLTYIIISFLNRKKFLFSIEEDYFS